METQFVQIWEQCLRVIEENTPPQSFNTWFKPIVPVAYENNVLTIQVPSQFFYEYLESHFVSHLEIAIKKVLGQYGRLEYSIVMDYNGARPVNIKLPASDRADTENPAVKAPNLGAGNEIMNPFAHPSLNKIKVDSQLNKNYSFGNFVEGECNRLARSAGFAVAERPGKTAFNPLFIYSATGLGKTHLCHAIGLETKRQNPDLVVLYVQAEQFIQQFLNSCKNKSRNDFVHFYQMIDVLIVDDIQFFAQKAATQDAFFHIFNHLQQNGKQLIFSCDKPPVELKDMEPRLLSRFKWGLSADLQLPDLETRRAILKLKAYNESIELPEEVMDYLALNIKTNIREMEGVLISLIAQSSLNRKAITLELAKQMIDKYISNTSKEISINSIVNVVCSNMGLSIEEFRSNTRKRNIVQARQLAMYLSKKYTQSSLIAIGQQCGNKDHATVLHSIKTIANMLETDKQFCQLTTNIEKSIL